MRARPQRLPLTGLILLLTTAAHAQTTVYWDINSTAAGSGGATPAGNWSTSAANWNSSSDGTGATAVWNNTGANNAVFAAGTDATGTYTVSIITPVSVGNLTTEEGNVTLTANTLTLAGASGSAVTTAAGTTLNISSILAGSTVLNKAGDGTLVLNGAGINTHSGAININAGTLQIAKLVADTAIGNTSAVTVASGANFVLNGTETIGSLAGAGTVDAVAIAIILTTGDASNTAFSGVIKNSAGTLLLTKAGTGTFTLSGANTYDGATTVSAGTLLAAGNTALGTTAGGTSVTSGATLALQGGITIGAEALTLNGAGVGSAGALLNVSGNNTYGGAVSLGSASTIGSTAGTLTLNGVISGGAALTKAGAGTVVFGAANTYTGSTTLNAGTLRISADSGLGTAPLSATAGHLTFNGGVLETTATFTLAANRGIALGTGGGTFDVDAGTGLSYNGILAGSGALTKADTGTLILGGGTTNTHSGAVNVNAGTLQIAKTTVNTALGNASAVTVASGATLAFNGGVGETFGSLAGAGTVDNLHATAITLTFGDAGNTTFSGILQDTGGNLSIGKAGAGTLTLTGANDYAGTTTISAGTLQIGNGGTAGSLGTGAVVNAAALVFNRSDAITVSNAISGAGTLTQAGAGTLTLNTANSYTGATTVSAGTLVASNATALGTTAGGVTVSSGATLALKGNTTIGAEALNLSGTGVDSLGALQNVSDANTYGGVITLGASATIGNTAGTLTLGGNIVTASGRNLTLIGAGDTTANGVISGAGNVIKEGSGTLTLGGANSYTGDTFINAGAVRLNAADRIANTSDIVLANTAGATLDLNNFNDTVASLSGGGAAGGNITLGSGTLTASFASGTQTYSGAISGSGGFTKAGAGIQIFDGSNTYGGTTTVSGGTLIAASNAALGTTAGGTTVSGGILGLQGGISIANETLSLSATSNAVALRNYSGDNSFLGPITLAASVGIQTDSGSALTLRDAAMGTSSLFLTNNGTTTISGAFAGGEGALTQNLGSTGTLVIAETGSYTRTTSFLTDVAIQSGSLFVNGTLNTGINGRLTFGATGSGATLGGTGDITLSGGIWFSGPPSYIMPGTAPGEIGTLTLNADLNLNSHVRMAYDLGNPDNSDKVILNGILGSNAGALLNVNAVDGFAANQNYTLIDYSGGSVSSPGFLPTLNLIPLGYDYTLTNDTTNKRFILGVGAYTGAAYWDGSGSDTTTIQGGTGTWNATNTNWTTSTGVGNGAWVDNLTPIFQATAGTVTVAAPVSVHGMTFNTTGYTITGSTITLGDATAITTNATTTTIASTLAGSNGLAKSGTGTLILTGTNNVTGGTTINAGTLQIGNAGTTGSLGAGDVINNGTLAFNRSDTPAVTNAISGTGALTKTGGASSTLTLSGNNNYSGATTVTTGTLIAASNTALGTTAAGTTVATGAALALQGDIAIGSEALSLTGTGVSTTGALRNISGDNSFAGAITLTGATSIGADAGTLSLTGAIGGAFALTKVGAGTVVLDAANGYTGATTISAGTLVAADNTALGTTAAGTTVSTGATLALRDGITIGAETLSLGATSTLANLSGDNTYGGAITKTGATTISAQAGTLTLGSTVGGNFASTFDTAAGTTINANGVMSGTGTLTKTGTGTLVYGAANTFSGATTISAGTLAGTGGSTSATTIADDARLSPGVGGVGTLTLGALVLNNTSVLEFDLGTGSDRLQVNGNLTLDGILNVTDSGGFGASSSYRLIDYTGAFTNNTLSVGAVPMGFSSYTIQTSVANQVNLVLGSYLGTAYWDGADSVADSTVDGGTSTWNGTSTNWTTSTGANNGTWLDNLTPIFQGTAGTVTVAAPVSVHGMTFNTAGYTVTGSTITLGDTTAINTNHAGNTTIDSVIAGANGLTKTGTGTLTLSGTSANTYTGGTFVNDGTLALNKTAGTTAIATGPLHIGDATGSAGSAAVSLLASNQIADTVDVTLSSDGKFNVGTHSETIDDLAGTGTLAVSSGGSLTIDKIGGAISAGEPSGAFTGVLEINGTLNLNGGIIGPTDSTAGTGVIHLTDGNTLEFQGDTAFGGTLSLGAGTTLKLTDANLDLATLTFTGESVIDFSGTASTLSVGTLNLEAGALVTILNWTQGIDAFYAQFWPDAAQDQSNNGNTAPMNQIVFAGWNADDTGWSSYNNEIFPQVPEPSSYGFLLLGAGVAFVALRRRKIA